MNLEIEISKNSKEEVLDLKTLLLSILTAKNV